MTVILEKQLFGSAEMLLLSRFNEFKLTSLQTNAGTRVRGVLLMVRDVKRFMNWSADSSTFN